MTIRLPDRNRIARRTPSGERLALAVCSFVGAAGALLIGWLNHSWWSIGGGILSLIAGCQFLALYRSK